MRFFSAFASFFLFLIAGAAIAVVLIINHYSENLPDYSFLKDYQPATLSRVYANDGRMMATLATEQRIFVPIKAIPPRVIDAFLSAEDEDFYKHSGVDYLGILRAILVNLHNLGRDRHPMGASTITQQVAKNILLNNEVSVSRKVREAILATRLEKVLTKNRILEIYLNEIFLGNHSYGVAAAALNYFNKSLDELTIGEAAYLAALPKAPNNYNPIKDHEAAIGRRNWVISRMVENNHLTKDEAEAATKETLLMHKRDEAETVSADYFAEEVRRRLIDVFGEPIVLEGGLAVKTSLDSHLQTLATRSLKDGLVSFDRRERGWRGPVTHFIDLTDWKTRLSKVAVPPGGEDWRLAIVLELHKTEVRIGLTDGTKSSIPWREMSWARRELPDDTFGPPIREPSNVVSVGDVILVDQVEDTSDEETDEAEGNSVAQAKKEQPRIYTLRQVPKVQGAIVALDPHTGRVYAMTGGFSERLGSFNRATQAQRQPGSAFKPFVYMAALDKGFTPSSLVLDAPFDYFQGPGLPLWHPENYSKEFYGPSPLRVGIEKSRNVMTVRLANAIGMPTVIQYAKKFDVVDDMPELLSFSLGAKETTPLRLASAYGMIVNGGKRITPTLIDRVMDRDGHTVWRADKRECAHCEDSDWLPTMLPPDLVDDREQVEDPRTAYQMVSILEGVVQRGTAIKLRDLDIPLAGKTGTTNDGKDAWFVGFTPDLVACVYVGFDDPKPLGSHETGASVAVPIFKAFIQEALKDTPATPFRVPPGLRMVRVNPDTGALATAYDKNAIWESFIPGTEPQEGIVRPILDGSITGAASESAASALSSSTLTDSDMAVNKAVPASKVESKNGSSPLLGGPVLPRAKDTTLSPTVITGTPPLYAPQPNGNTQNQANPTQGTGGLY